ncbi:hypothetical protein CMV_020626 [Castanea mollissima]|uniref:Late embryogenesis abundant protein LEA-2 subgroup domain-containing protein n=1 Tax=Castanea mollissima TaxID=60419 RepID=A0A8J4QYN7_9ROSI|nr:hypothetical protein CMV_020626 [Castanea mollissima]
MQNPSRPAAGYPPANGYPPPQPGAAYPYNAPYYPNQPYPPPYNNQPYRASTSRTFVRTFLIAMIVVFITMGVIIFILWLVLRPRLPEFRVDSLSITNFSTSDTSVSGNWNARLSVYNPNKKLSIYYDAVDSAVSYRTEIVAETRIPPFKQSKRNQTFVDASFAAKDAYVDRRALGDINADRTRGTLYFSVRLLARAEFKTGGWRARNKIVKVLCQSLLVSISPSNSSASGSGKLEAPKDCQVGWTCG